MQNNFEKITENLKDPSRVRNFLRDVKNDSERKQYSLLFHIVYALVCAFGVYFASDTIFPQGPSLFFLFLAPSMCVFTFLYSPMALKILPVLLPPLFIGITSVASGFEFFPFASALFVYLLCIVSAAFITKAVLSGYTKTELFITLCVTFGIISFCQTVFSFIASYGTFSFTLLLDTINGFFDDIVSRSVAIANTPEGLEAFRALAVDGKELTDAEIIKLVKDSVKLTVDVTKPLLPSFFAFSCMLFGFVTVAVFSFFAKHFKINVFVCIMDNSWIYRPSVISAVVYDIVFFVFVISMFVNLPQNISVTVMNLMFVLTPLMYISGIRGIYTMLFKKNKNPLKSKLITAIIVIAATMILGGVAFLIIGSAGVTFITTRNREEKIAIPLVYASDLQLLNKLSEEQSKKESDNEKKNDNTENQ